MKQFFFERYAGGRLIQLSLVSFSTPESADSRNFFQVVKSFALQMLSMLRNFSRVIFQSERFYSKFC